MSSIPTRDRRSRGSPLETYGPPTRLDDSSIFSWLKKLPILDFEEIGKHDFYDLIKVNVKPANKSGFGNNSVYFV